MRNLLQVVICEVGTDAFSCFLHLGCISRTQNIPNMCFEGYQTDRHREITIRKITEKIDEIYLKKA